MGYSRLMVWANIRGAINAGIKACVDGHDPLLARRLVKLLDDMPLAEPRMDAGAERTPTPIATGRQHER